MNWGKKKKNHHLYSKKEGELGEIFEKVGNPFYTRLQYASISKKVNGGCN